MQVPVRFQCSKRQPNFSCRDNNEETKTKIVLCVCVYVGTSTLCGSNLRFKVKLCLTIQTKTLNKKRKITYEVDCIHMSHEYDLNTIGVNSNT